MTPSVGQGAHTRALAPLARKTTAERQQVAIRQAVMLRKQGRKRCAPCPVVDPLARRCRDQREVSNNGKDNPDNNGKDNPDNNGKDK